jgi:hypothetical protein
MPDEDYSAYLKRQSYDDLLAISYSLDKDAQPERYAMVLSEIAAREKRGEKPEGKWNFPFLPCMGVLGIGWFILDMIESKPGWKLILDLVFGVGCLVLAWFDRKPKTC